MSAKKVILYFLIGLLLIGIALGRLKYRDFMSVPSERLASDAFYPELPESKGHHYLDLPIDHNAPGAGTYRAFYHLSPHFQPGSNVIFLLTDGQMELVNTLQDFDFFEQVLAEESYVLIGRRGHSPTLFPEVYRDDGTIDFKRAMNLYGSDQHVEDIEIVRQDLEVKGYLEPGSKIMLFGASGAGVLAQQYLSKYGHHVSRAIVAVAGAPDLARRNGWTFSPSFLEFNKPGAEALASLGDVNINELSYWLYQTGRDASNAREAQLSLLGQFQKNRLSTSIRYKLRPSYNLSLIKFLMKTPSADAVKVRWYELVGHDLMHYSSQSNPPVNLLYSFSQDLLHDFIGAERAGEIQPKEFSINRSIFNGEVLIMSGSEDVVFSDKMCVDLAREYNHAKCVIFEDGHRLHRNPEHYMKMRKTFFEGGLTSLQFQDLYNDPQRIDH